MATRRAVLLIADIGGYTEYMQFHRSVLGHAEAATRRMLDKVVKAGRDFDLVEVEGDAAFLSREIGESDDPETLAGVMRAVVAMHRAFHEQRRLIEDNMCPCGSCRQTSDLKLKFVAHVGEVASQTIKRRRKLVGLDVIHVHRLLKNAVPLPEYVLLSEELYRSGGAAPSEPAMQELAQDLEGIGPVRTWFVDVEDIAAPVASLPDPSWPRRIGGTFAMVGRGLPYVLGRRPPAVSAR